MSRSRMPVHVDQWFDSQSGGCGKHANALACSKYLTGRYFSGGYTGSLFDPLGSEPANLITRADLYAVSALAMPKFARKSILDSLVVSLNADEQLSHNCRNLNCLAHIQCMLKRIPKKANIFTTPESTFVLANDSLWPALEQLFRAQIKEAGAAGLSKTLARKRPGFLPILDSVAQARLKSAGAPGNEQWLFFRKELRSSIHVRPGLAVIRRQATIPGHISDLRLIDVAVWMRQHIDGRVLKDRVSCPPL